MSSTTFTITPHSANSAGFVAWASGVSAALDAVGLTRQNDTGVVTSWGAQTLPSINTLPYFEIRKLDAPLTGACPVYIRIAYGAANPTTIPAIQVSTGTGTDGAGNLTGPGSTVAPVTITPTGSGSDNNARTCYAACDGHGFVLFLSLESVTLRCLLVVDRQRRPDGTAQPNPGFPNTGYTRILHQVSTNSTITVDPVSGTVTSLNRVQAATGRAITAATSMLNAAGEMTMFPVGIVNRQGSYVSKMLLAYPVADAALGMDIPLSFLGATRTYRPFGNLFGGADTYASTGMTLAMWWSD